MMFSFFNCHHAASRAEALRSCSSSRAFPLWLWLTARRSTDPLASVFHRQDLGIRQSVKIAEIMGYVEERELMNLC